MVPVGPGRADAAAGDAPTSTTDSEAPPGIVVLPGPVWIGGPDPTATADASTVDEPAALDELGVVQVAGDLQPEDESPAISPALDAARVVIVEDDWDTQPGDDAIVQAAIDVEDEASVAASSVTDGPTAADDVAAAGEVAAAVEIEPAEPAQSTSPAMAAPGTDAEANAPASKPPSALLGFIRSGGRRRSAPSAQAPEAAPVVAAAAVPDTVAEASAPAPATRAPRTAPSSPRAAGRAPRPQPVAAPKRAPAKASTRKATATCPYCAEPLATPPVASGRCPRCRQRIVVRRVGDRSILLTEAALPVFLAERRRAVHAGPWTRARDRWLALAVEVDAAPGRVARIQRDPISDAAVAAARNLYVSTAEQAARQARRERRWDHASRLSLELASTLYRTARSPRPVPADALAAHREGLAAALRGIAEVAKSAELRAAGCCSTCTDDDGRVVRISDELRAPTLPHDACPKGLCRCRWYLADRDRAIVSGLLRRQTRPTRRKAGPAA